ncbi:MAG: acyl-CoA dehydrogenase family protein, partial [Acidimicrobiales bacterium]
LGTVGVPTGEVTLDGARCWLAGGSSVGAAARDGRGLNRMMEMVNGSRFGVALMGLGIHRRSFLEAAIYAARRTQWGRRIDEYPLVRETLVDLLVDLEAGMAVTYECAGSAHAAEDADEARLLRRILIPLAKMRATRVALWAASTALEVFGGNGYMTDWPMARQLRDAQCHTIWEGTENILCLDVRRAMRSEQAHLALVARVGRALDAASAHKVLAPAVDTVSASLTDAQRAIDHLSGVDDDLQLLHSRRLAELLADTAQAALLLDEAAWSLERNGDARKALVARRFAARKLADRPVRGILDPDRSALDQFAAITRYGRVEAGDLAA